MTTALATMNDLDIESISKVIINGDVSSLSNEQRVVHYLSVARRVGVDPTTKPFEYIKLNGKLVLYATKNCGEQLRVVHGVSVTDMHHASVGDTHLVTVRVQNKTGRTDMATGAVTIAGLKGDALANAIMKAETKAKRRATLSLCGLGMLDETELETIPAANIELLALPAPDGPAVPIESPPDMSDRLLGTQEPPAAPAPAETPAPVAPPGFWATEGADKTAALEEVGRLRKGENSSMNDSAFLKAVWMHALNRDPFQMPKKTRITTKTELDYVMSAIRAGQYDLATGQAIPATVAK